MTALAVVSAQDPITRSITAIKAQEPLRIDGVLDEAAWATAPIADAFTQFEPVPNVPARARTEVRVLYDNTAVYFGAVLYDANVDSLLFRLWQRDDVEIGEWFDVPIDPYRSGSNGFEFLVSAANVQTDMVVADEDEDTNWNAVWESAVGLTPAGWVVEIRIPFSAIRFPEAEVQTWSVNFLRHVGRTREKSFWSAVDPQKEGWMRQAGTLTGITDVEAPLRLSLFPYASAYVEHFPHGIDGVNDWSRSFNGGMDVKYGINDAYTLDMTLIPDFGQVVSDNRVLNLSPFEVEYNENRQFFTEGTELFQRGGLFYSRRIGGEPLLRGALSDALLPGEEVVDDPATSRILNATKISGRGRMGLGFGVLNAITVATYATVRDSLGNEREVLTDPLTNYSVLVADQLLKNNGYLSLTNTNVLRDGHTYDANATALSFNLNNKKRTVNANGGLATTRQFPNDNHDEPGYAGALNLEKTGGNWTYGAEYRQTDRDYDPNDLGIFYFNNLRSSSAFVKFTNYIPKGHWMRWDVEFNTEYLRVMRPDHFFNLAFELSTFRLDRHFNAIGGFVRTEPVITYDPYEPRVPGRLYEFPRNAMVGAWVSSDYSLRFALDARLNYRWFDDLERRNIYVEVEPRFRVNDKLFFLWSVSQHLQPDDVGWVAFQQNDSTAPGIIFGRRDLFTTTNTLSARYIFTNKLSLTARARHYWSRANYTSFALLGSDGRLAATEYDGLDAEGGPLHDVDYDAFNVDLVITWNFAPGSQLTLAWKNSTEDFSSSLDDRYVDDLGETLRAPQANNFSLKVLWYIDAPMLFRKR